MFRVLNAKRTNTIHPDSPINPAGVALLRDEIGTTETVSGRFF